MCDGYAQQWRSAVSVFNPAKKNHLLICFDVALNKLPHKVGDLRAKFGDRSISKVIGPFLEDHVRLKSFRN